MRPPSHPLIHELRRLDALNALDAAFAGLVGGLCQGDAGPVELAAALASAATSRGHICVDLAAIAGRALEAWREEDQELPREPLPDLAGWLAALQASGVVGGPGETHPLILSGCRLYLHRYWRYERSVAESIRERSAMGLACEDPRRAGELLATLFPPPSGPAGDQKAAAALAILRRFLVISGGPGTGKTRTVARVLAMLVALWPERREPRIAMCAPTGKAAARLSQSIAAARTEIAGALPEIAARIPHEAGTIHRLLGFHPGMSGFRHGPEHLLPIDIIVVDEASMIDLALMARLLAAIPPQARVILLGDKDQLASVEPGSVLGEICGQPGIGTFRPESAEAIRRLSPDLAPGADDGTSIIADSVVLLRHSYRFEESGGVARLSRLVNAGDAAGALEMLAGRNDAVAWRDQAVARPYPKEFLGEAAGGFAEYLASPSPEVALASMERYRVLCAHRRGPFGVAHLNRVLEYLFRRRGLIGGDHTWFHLRPILIAENDAALGLFNGDSGVTWIGADGLPMVHIGTSDGAIRQFRPWRLPAHDTVFAMTVHKAQGSEFDRVALVLPERPSPVLTRELLYTGITRARAHVSIWAPQRVLRHTIEQRIERASGLGEALHHAS